MRDGNAQAQSTLSRRGCYRQVRDNLRVKEVTLDKESGVRRIVCHNPDPARPHRDITSRVRRVRRARRAFLPHPVRRRPSSLLASSTQRIIDATARQVSHCHGVRGVVSKTVPSAAT